MEYVLIVIAVAVVAYVVYGRKGGVDVTHLPTGTSGNGAAQPTQVDPVDIPTGTSTQRSTTKPPKSFSKMTKVELLAYAEENGIDVNKSDTKAEIVKKIKTGF